MTDREPTNVRFQRELEWELDRLAEVFSVARPQLVVRKPKRDDPPGGAWYVTEPNGATRIEMAWSYASLRGMLRRLRHEFGHHLRYVQEGRNSLAHDQRFWEVLAQVMDA